MPQITLQLSKKLFTPKFFPYMFDYSHRWEVYYGGAGSSKSYSITQKLIIRCCNEKIRVLVCRRYGSTLRNTCFSLFKEILTKWKLLPYVKIKETDMSITFANGSQIIMMGLDEETKLLSLNNIGTIWVEEAYETSSQMVEQLNLRMRSNNEGQQLILSYNPISKNSWIYNFVEVNPPANMLKLHSTFKDNPFLSQEYIDAMEDMKERNPQKAKIYYYGEYGVNPEGVIFHNWKVEDFNKEEPLGKLAIGLDFGFVADPSTLIASYIDEEGRKLYVFQEWYQKGKTNREIAEAIKYLGFAKSTIIADSAEQKSIEEIRREGISRIKPAVKGKDSIRQGIDKLMDYSIIVHPSCGNLVVELENYSWKKDKNTDLYLNEPIDEYNHCVDALRYSLQCVGKAELKTMDKSLLGL